MFWEYDKLWEVMKGRKIILYYADRECFSQYRKTMLKKTMNLFTAIENGPDFVLVWLQSASGAETEAYNRRRKQPVPSDYGKLVAYAKACQHIYAINNPDWKYWVQIADVFYGNYHSCILDFLIQGKPVMILDHLKNNTEARVREEGEAIQGGIIYNDFIYYSSGNNNALLKSHIFNSKTEFLGEFSTEKDWGHLYTKAVRYKDTIVFAPQKANSIAMYDIAAKTFQSIQLPKINYPYDENFKFSDLFCYQNYIYFVPNKIPVFLELNMDTYDLTALTSWYDSYKSFIQFPYDNLFLNGGCKVENSYFIPSAQNDVILEFDLRNKIFIFHKLGDTGHYYLTISFDGTFFWLTGDKSSITRWNKQTGSKKEISYPKYQPCTNPFSHSLIIGQKLLLIPNRASMFLEVDISNQKSCKFKIYPINSNYTGKKYNFCELHEERLIFQEEERKKLYVYQIPTKKLSICYPGVSHKTLGSLLGITGHIHKELKEYEKEQYTLDNLLKLIKYNEVKRSSKIETEATVGVKIHRKLCL